MRISEIVTIYLAAAAPVGVAYYLHREVNANRAQVLPLAVGTALVWPITLLAVWFDWKRFIKSRRDLTEGRTAELSGEKVEQAKRQLLMALRHVEEYTEEVSGTMRQRTDSALFAARESVERYVGLNIAAADARPEAAPSIREMELYRAAGRAGDDLTIAGRCVHRRNVARLFAHRDRARTELLHALAEIGDAISDPRIVTPLNNPAAHRRAAAMLLFYGLAIDLLSQLNDQRAAMSVARLLDTECARLHRLESFDSLTAHERGSEGEICSTTPQHSTPPPMLPTSPATTLPQRSTLQAQG